MSVNVDEILFPSKANSSQLSKKRKETGGSADENREPAALADSAAKRPRPQDIAGPQNLNSADELLRAVADGTVTAADTEPLNERNVKKMIAAFERRVLKNQEMRIKFSDQPEKFMESEVELNAAIHELQTLATVPQFYASLLDSNIPQHFVYLLNHENTDISCALVHLLQELTDGDTLNDSDEGAEVITNLILDSQLITALIKNVERLNEADNKDEAEGVYDTLSVVENVFEYKPDEVTSSLIKHGFLAWLMKRLKAKMPFDANCLYCSEILAILLQNSDECKKALGEMDGVDVLLQQLASYKRHNPVNVDEVEYMENLFNSLCASLMEPANLHKFLDGEGLQLMNLMLREKKMSRESALKVLDYATTGKIARDNCDKFVDILGLRTLFPLFMKTPSKHKRRGYTGEEHEEHVCAIIASLLKNCSSAQRQRVLAKFTENDCEKVERLMELHFKYIDKVDTFDIEMSKKKAFLKKTRQHEELDDEEEIYMKKLDNGLFTLQLVDFIVAEIFVNGSSTAKDRVLKILSMKNSSLKILKQILAQYAENLGGSSTGSNEKNDDKSYILALLNKMWA